MAEKALVPLEQKQVVFYNDEKTAVLVEEDGRREVYVPLRQLRDLLGVSYQGQIRRINEDPVLAKKVKGVNITFTPSGARGGGPQTTNCLPLDYLIRYQRECFKVLKEAFVEGRLTADAERWIVAVGFHANYELEMRQEFEKAISDTVILPESIVDVICQIENEGS